MRKKYELDSIDNTCTLTIGETTLSDRVTFSIAHAVHDPVEFDLTVQDFYNMCDLRYRLDLNLPASNEKLKLTQVA